MRWCTYVTRMQHIRCLLCVWAPAGVLTSEPCAQVAYICMTGFRQYKFTVHGPHAPSAVCAPLNENVIWPTFPLDPMSRHTITWAVVDWKQVWQAVLPQQRKRMLPPHENSFAGQLAKSRRVQAAQEKRQSNYQYHYANVSIINVMMIRIYWRFPDWGFVKK